MSTQFSIISSTLYTIAAIATISPVAVAQNIIPNVETNTLVNQNNNLYTITGGTLSADQLNAFHKFDLFNLDTSEIANFLTQQELKNLFVGVNSSSPSIINGLIELTGSDANFIFSNPSGVVFGAGASFNLPADLTVTTANRIGFGDDLWFDVLNPNDYSTLIGNPTSFAFDAVEPSAIINEGEITLNNGDLSLYAGGIAHTGSIRAQKVTVQSVDGQTTVRILPEGSLIGIEVGVPTEEINIPASNLLELSQNQAISEITKQQVNADFNTVISGDIDTSSIVGTGGDIKILGESLLLTGDANIDVSGELGGGDINIGGNYQGKGNLENSQFTLVEENVAISADALTTGDGGKVIIWADNKTTFLGSLSSRGGEISGDGGFAEISGKNSLIYRGDADLSASNGDFGTLLFDPINIEISNQATATVLESDIENGITTNLVFQATNGITFGTLDDDNLIFPTSNADIVFTANSDGMDGGDISMPASIFFKASSPAGNIQGRNITFSGNNISLGDLDTNSGVSGTPEIGIPAPGGSVTINATGNVTTGNLDVSADSDQMNSPRIPNTGSSGDIFIATTGGSITTETLSANAAEGTAGDITLQAPGNILVDGNLAAGPVFGEGGSGGAISLTSSGGTIQVNGLTGSKTANITNGAGGAITFNAPNGNLTVGSITSSGFNSGNITLTAGENISAGTLISDPNLGTSGSIAVDAGGDLTLTGIDDPVNIFDGVVSAFSSNNSSGAVDLSAGGDINLNCPYNCIRVGADPDNLALTSANAGSISLSAGGAINLQNIFTGDTSGFTDSLPLFLDASNLLGDGGQISLKAANDIQVGTMSVSSFGIGSSAGSIEIISTGGSVNTAPLGLGETVLAGRTLGTSTESAQSNAGTLSIEASGDITTGFLRFWGTQDGGTVNLVSQNGGTINTTAGDLELFTIGNGKAGNAIIRTDGTINLGAINATSASGNGGNLTFNSNSVNFLENVRTSGVLQIESDGDTVLSSDSNVEFELDTLRLSSNSGNARLDSNLVINNGNVDILAELDIDLAGNITTNGGNINLRSNNGNITTQNLDASNAGGVGGNVSLNALGNPQTVIETGDINTSGDTGGDIEIFSVERISAGQIISRGIVGNGGDVTIDPNSVDIVFIDAQGGGLGSGGAVDITVTGLFQATGAFVDDTGLLSSISTFGGAGSGPITIRHDGGDLFIPFIVGDPSTNGTLGALNSGDFTIDTFRVFPGSFFLGNISIITSDRLPNALDNAIDDTLPKIQEEVEAKDKGFFIDEFFTRQFESYFTGNPLANDIRIKSINEIQDVLSYIENTTGFKPGLVYGLFQPESVQENCLTTGESQDKKLQQNQEDSCVVNPRSFAQREDDILTLITVTKNEEIQFTILPEVTRGKVRLEAGRIRAVLDRTRSSSDPNRNFNQKFRDSSDTFHQWLIGNLDEEVIELLDNVTFILDDTLRSVPLAAIGKETDECEEHTKVLGQCLLDFVINDFSVGLMPSMSLTETNYQPLTDLNLRIAGASNIEGQNELKFVPQGIEKFEELWLKTRQNVDSQLTEDLFTIDLVSERQRKKPTGIVHWSTHAEFDGANETYIAFQNSEGKSDGRLGLNQIRDMGLGDVNLLILDACNTALDVIYEIIDTTIREDNALVNSNPLLRPISKERLTSNRETELGFAGFAHKAETNSVLATLWQVDDRISGVLMSRFYSEVTKTKDTYESDFSKKLIKAEALRQTQLDFLDQSLRIEDGTAIWSEDELDILLLEEKVNRALEEEARDEFNDDFYQLSDPIYWSAFTMVGSPW